MLIANKSDLPAEHWEVNEREGAAFASRIGAAHIATSAKTGANVEVAFATLVKRVTDMRGDDNKMELERKRKVRKACAIL